MKTVTISGLIDLINDVCEQDAAVEVCLTVGESSKTFDELGLDSLSLLSVVAQLESRHGITIGLEVGANAKTPEELLDLVLAKLSASGAAA